MMCWSRAGGTSVPRWKLMRKLLKKYGFVPRQAGHGRSEVLCVAAASDLGITRRHERGQWRNNRAEISLQPTRRREYKMQGFRVSGVSPKISLNSRSHPQHFQRPTSSHFPARNAPSLSRVGYEHVARGSRGRLENIRGAEFSCSSFNDVTTPSRRPLTIRRRAASSAATAIGAACLERNKVI